MLDIDGCFLRRVQRAGLAFKNIAGVARPVLCMIGGGAHPLSWR
jgi:hypothetical protein